LRARKPASSMSGALTPTLPRGPGSLVTSAPPVPRRPPAAAGEREGLAAVGKTAAVLVLPVLLGPWWRGSRPCRRSRRRRALRAAHAGTTLPREQRVASRDKAADEDPDFVTLGSLRISRLGLGTISWSADDEAAEAKLGDLASGAVATGSLLDTAERYGSELGPPFDRWPFGRAGRCEEILGGALRGRRGAVATKFTPTPWRMAAADVVAACRASARRLGVEAVDLYQIHHPDIVQPLKKFGISNARDNELWEGLADCMEMGLARNVGVCNYGPTLLGRAQDALRRRGFRLATNQINFSLLYRRQGVMPTIQACRESGIGVLAYWPLAMGLLTGAASIAAPGGRAQRLQQYLDGGGSIPPGGVQPLLAEMRAVARRRGRTCSQVALNWIIAKGAVPIPGARTLERFSEYRGALGWRLTDDEVDTLEAAAEALPFDFEGAGFRYSSAKFVGYGTERWYLD